MCIASELDYGVLVPRVSESMSTSSAGKHLAVNELTVVVVNWGTPEITLRSVGALLGDGVPKDRLVVVDNGSQDDSFERFEAELQGCRLVRLTENIGYPRAANVGARALPGSAYLFVNNDAFVHRAGTVGALLRDLARDRTGMVFPRILSEDLSLQPSVGPPHTPGVALVLASGLSRFVPNRWQPRWSTHWDHSESRRIMAAAGVVMLIGSDVWERFGGFSEDATIYAEDIDLCWRTRNAGWHIWFTADAEFVHLGSATTSLHWGDTAKAELISRSEAEMIRRNLSPLRSWLTLVTIRAGLVLRSFVFAAMGRREAAASARAAFRGFGSRPEGTSR